MEFKIRNLIRMQINWPKFYQTFLRFDQILAQNTSMDYITTYKSKQQLKSSPKVIYESKKDFKIRNLIKNVNKLTKSLAF